ncbi:polyketide synthase dehydratase domain-containing protein, partial [Streptosporangium sp. NPDC006013]|uniref:polyketide synthase dehydratase domain-containing protein n=1 Tax=Streptosporangium sp. NPDC006013 TaxID=3155596 RepID=UPI0033AD5029
MDQVRQPVRFADGVRGLRGQGVRAYLELGPDGVLTAMADDTLTALAGSDESARSLVVAEDSNTHHLTTGAYAESDLVLVPVLRRDRDEESAAISALAELYVHGVAVDWRAVLPVGSRVELPTYAFQRKWFWPQGAGSRVGNVAAAGLAAASHPLLGAAMGLAGADGVLLTGRLSLRSHPWLADHAVGGMVIFPGTGFLELAIRAGDQVGCDLVEELTLVAPLVLGEDDAIAVQVWVGAAEESGRRGVSVYARPAEAADEEPWVEHAAGVLTGGGRVAEAFDATVWPPQGATAIELDGLYDQFAEDGLSYGPVFQGLRAAWRGADGEVFAEVVLPEQVGDAASFGMHPALLDAALHAVSFAGLDVSGGGRLPFSWSEVCLHAGGASLLRVRLARTGDDSVSVNAVDAVGEPVLSARSLVLRPILSDQLVTASRERGVERDVLFGVEWVPLTELPAADPGLVAMSGPDLLGLAGVWQADGREVRVHADLASLVEAGPVPGVVLAEVVADPAGGVVESAHELAARVLGLVQAWLADDRFGDSRLTVVTRGAVVAREGDAVADLPAAAVWGLVRSAQSENPGRFVLVDVDGQEISSSVLAGVLASGEPQVAVREGGVRVARLVRVKP